MIDGAMVFADMGSALVAIVESLPTEVRIFAVIALIYAGHKAIEYKYPPKSGDEEKYESLKEKISGLELYVTNHLTTEIHDLKSLLTLHTTTISTMTLALQEQTKAARDVEEEATRTNRSVNVVLSKLDELDKSIDTVDKSVIRLEGRIRQSP